MKPVVVTWTESYPTVSHRAEVSLVKVEDLGAFKGRALGKYEVRHSDVVIGTVESKGETLYRKVGRLSNPSGRAVRWSFDVRAPWSAEHRGSGYGYETRATALAYLCTQAARAGVLTGTAAPAPTTKAPRKKTAPPMDTRSSIPR